jgi:hypothetical protein
MDGLDRGHDADLGPADRGQLADLPADVHAHLEDGGLVIRTETKHGQRQADLVVLVALVLERDQLRGEDGRDRLLRRGLRDRARHADDERVEATAPRRRDGVEPAQRVRDLDDRGVDAVEGDAVRRVGHDRGRRAVRQRRADERVAVRVLARQRDEQVARDDLPRVDRAAEDRPEGFG